MRTQNDWASVLTGCGVRPTTVDQWAPVFANIIKDDTFSAGDADLIPFIAQMLIETSMLEKMSENLSYSAERLMVVWPHRFPTLEDAQPFAHNPQALANKVYGGRMGNDTDNDGWTYRGRGPGITGKANYQALGDAMGQDLIDNPDLLIQPHYALEAFIRWWEANMPDAWLGDARRVSERVNGGDTGLRERIAMTETVKGVMT